MSEHGWPSYTDGIGEQEQKTRRANGGAETPQRWQPDRTWPGPPAGQPPRARRTQAAPHQAADSAWAIAGGAAVFFGSLLPFVSFSAPGIGMNPGARAASALFGLVVLSLGIALRAAPRRYLTGTSAAALCLCALGALGYAITIVAGLAGTTQQDPFGDSVKVTFSPGIGILLALAGCVAAGVGAVRFLIHR